MKLQIYQFEIAEANFKQNKAKIATHCAKSHVNGYFIFLSFYIKSYCFILSTAFKMASSWLAMGVQPNTVLAC